MSRVLLPRYRSTLSPHAAGPEKAIADRIQYGCVSTLCSPSSPYPQAPDHFPLPGCGNTVIA